MSSLCVGQVSIVYTILSDFGIHTVFYSNTLGLYVSTCIPLNIHTTKLLFFVKSSRIDTLYEVLVSPN